MKGRLKTAGQLFPLLFIAIGQFASVGCSSGKPQDLRGPGPQVGNVYRHEVMITMTNGTLTAIVGGIAGNGQIDMTHQGVYEEEILAMVDGKVTKSRIKILTE
jgi:hypothetical protein